MINLIITYLIINSISNNYFFVTKHPQNLNNDHNYGVLGGKISNYLDLTNNEFMITFWFRFDDAQINKYFTLATLFNYNSILNEYLYLSDYNYITPNHENNKIQISKNANIFFVLRFKLSNNLINLNLTLFNQNNNSYDLTQQLNKNININNIIFIINRLNLREKLIIENLIFYNNINEYSNEQLMEGVSNIIYFINFRNNYPNTKWLMNEINNEFGPSRNGMRRDSNIWRLYNTFIANFNDNTKEIEWESGFNKSFLHLNNNLLAYLNYFELNFSNNIFVKFDIYLNYFNSNNNSLSIVTNILEFYNFQFNIKSEINTYKNTNISGYIYIYNDKIRLDVFTKYIPYSTMYKGMNFIDGSYLGIKFLMINISKLYSSNYKIKTNILFNNDSLFCDTTCLIEKEFNNINLRITDTYFRIFVNNSKYENIIISVFLKELMFGSGNLIIENKNDLNNLIIRSKQSINTFLLYNNQIKDLERRFGFNNNTMHSYCSVSNCSICRKNLYICEYCYKNYYLNSGNCILNIDNTKFVNNYSMLNIINYETNSYNKISSEKYIINTNISTFTNYYLFHFSFNLENSNLGNLLLRIINYDDYINIYYKKILDQESIFRISGAYNNKIYVNEFTIYNYNNINNSNNLTNFNLKIHKESIDCNQGYKDILCQFGCSRDINYLIKFDEDHLFYNKCLNLNLDNYYKNQYYHYYSKCPNNCKTCDIKSNYFIYCTLCNDGYILKNYECILKLMIDCQTESNFIISNENSNINLFVCANLCNYINTLNNEGFVNLINYYTDNNNLCSNNDNITLKCKNNTHYYNIFKKKCIKCPNNICFSTECNNCTDVNNFTTCSDGYIFFQYKCILNNNYDINCTEYELDNNYVCSNCKNDYYLYSDKKCYKQNTNQCLKYKNNSHICEICNDGYYIDNNDNKCYICRENCVTCANNYDNCLSCRYNFILQNNKCDYNKIYNENCEILNQNKECIKCENGYYLNNLNLCIKCNNNCKTCNGRDTNCESCFLGYNLDLKLNICVKQLNNCFKINNNDVYQCIQCYSGYYLDKNICKKCSKNCLACDKVYNNCLICHDNEILKNSIEYNYCQSNCNFDKIEIFNNSDKSVNYLKIYSFYKHIVDKDYFVIINIPAKIYEDHLILEQMRKFIFLKFENDIINYKTYLDIKFKKLCIIPILNINSYKKTLLLNITIKSNIFEKIKICRIKEKIINITILNKEIKLYENDIKKEMELNYPTLNKNSTEYKNVEKTYEVTKITSEYAQYGTLFVSIFSPSILSKISVYLPSLLYFNYLTLLKIDFGNTINTILTFVDFNSSIYDISKYIKLNNFEIEKRIHKIITNNPKLINIKILFISHFSFKYILLNFILWIIVILKFILCIYSLIGKLIIKCTNNKKKNVIMDIPKSNSNGINLNKIKNFDQWHTKFKVKLKTHRFKIFLNSINTFLYKYFISFLTVELPNIIFSIIIYSSSLNNKLLYFISFFINSILVYNYMLVIFYFSFVVKIIKLRKINKGVKDVKIIIIPFKINNNSYLLYYKIVENLRIIFTLTVIIYLNQNIMIQIIFLIVIQIVYFIYTAISYEKNLSIIILIVKEFTIFLYLIFTLIILIIGKNTWSTNILFILIILIILFSLIELIYSFCQSTFILLKSFYRYIKIKKKTK